jgi:hypothetical protein
MAEGGKQKYKDNEFYSVADKKKVTIKAEDITTSKKVMKSGKTSYMLRAEKDGRKLVKFVNEATYKKYC